MSKKISPLLEVFYCIVLLIFTAQNLKVNAQGESASPILRQADKLIHFNGGDENTGLSPVYIKLETEDFEGVSPDDPNAAWMENMSWHPQWSRGGNSGWWGAMGAAKAATGAITRNIYVPRDGEYAIWMRYQDYFGEAEPFSVVVDYNGGTAKAEYGQTDIGKQPDPQSRWAYVWDKKTVSLKKGAAKISIELEQTSKVPRDVDALILTDDANWIPHERGFPPQAYSNYLQAWAKDRQPLKPLIEIGNSSSAIPRAWTLPQIAGRDFWYLGATDITSGYPFPINIHNEPQKPDSVKAFTMRYAANPAAAPIFGNPLTAIQLSISRTGELLKPDDPMRQYILANKRPFVFVGNYGSAGKIANSYPQLEQIFGDLWLGIISGENSYLRIPFIPDNNPLDAKFKDNNYQWMMTGGKQQWQQKINTDWASTIANPYEKIIPALSVGTLPHVHQMAEVGSQMLAAESAGAMPYVQAQAAFVRGAGRQYNKPWLWYFGASFGSAIRTFTNEGPYFIDLEGQKIDSRNAVIGPSLAHIRRTVLFAYLQGATSMFPEQGYNLFDSNGELNPMGWSYDEMLRLAAKHPGRGVTNTPVAVLMDKAHGWDKYAYNGMRIWDKKVLDRSDEMINQFFNVAYYPFPKNEGDFATDLNVPFPNGYFGDIFDVMVTSPSHMNSLSSYKAVFCLGDTKLNSASAEQLKKYVENGGTLIINAEQVVPELGENFLGVKIGTTQKESSGVICERDGEKLGGTPFPYKESAATSASVIARAASGDPVAFLNKVGKGQVILTTASYLMGYDQIAMPYMAHLLLELTSGLQPVEVRGNCQYFVNLRPDGYVVTVSNNEGLAKMSDSPAELDMSKTADISLRIKDKPLATEDWIGDSSVAHSFPNEWLPEYAASKPLSWQKDADFYKTTVKLLPGEIRVYFIKTTNRKSS